MVRKKKQFISSAITIGLMVLIVACFASACQPTPEKAAVVNKANYPLEDLILEKADPNEVWTQTSDRIVWSDTRTVDNKDIGEYTVAVSMDVAMPEQPLHVPVVIIEPIKFKIDFMEKAAKYLMTGEIFHGTPSKQDVLMEILNFQKNISTHTIKDEYQEEVDEWLEELNDMYENAADSNREAKFEFEDVQGLILKSYPNNDNSIMRFSCYGSNLSYDTHEFGRGYSNSCSDSQQYKYEPIFEQTYHIADEAMKSLFEVPFALVHTDTVYKVNDLEYLWNDGEETILEQAHLLYYAREYNGIPSLYIDPAPVVWAEEITEFTLPYSREYARLIVNSSGIVRMDYQSFSETVTTLNENVKLMPFEEVLERFQTDVFYHNLWGMSKAEIKITRIEFGLVREPVKDNPDQYMMVPAWSFIGDISSGWANEQGVSIIALNAINGGVITDYPTIF